jgi:acyl carrier protein
MTLDDFLLAVERVAAVEGGLVVAETSLSSLRLDSLQMFELVVEVEDLTGIVCDETALPTADLTMADLYSFFQRPAGVGR